MENEAPEQEPTLEMDVSDAFETLASSLVGLTREHDALRQALARILEERKQLVELVASLSAQIKSLAALQASDHAALEVLMGCRVGTMGGSLAN